MGNAANVRNIAILGHAGAGKTTLIERLLFAGGSIKTMGELERGTMVSDHDPQSKTLGHSVETSLTHFTHSNVHVNLIDTPGYADFIGRAISILPAVETGAFVVDLHDGVEMVMERLMEVVEHRNKCRLIVINKIDSDQGSAEELLMQIQERFGSECLPLNLPCKDSEEVIDCFFKPAYDTETAFLSVRESHDALVDQVVEVDEELMELYLEQGEELSPEQLHNPFEQALREQHLIPICFVSGRTGAGIDLLLKVMTELMPAPEEGNPPLFYNHEEEVELTHDADQHVVAHAFKIVVDPFMGRLAVMRVHQGTITPESQLYIGDGRKPFKVHHLFQLQGAERVSIDKARPGDLCAVAKVDDISFDDVLHDSHDEDNFHLKSLEFVPPMYGLAVRPAKRGDEQKLGDTLKKILAEDPSLVLEHRVNLNETVLQGVGEVHLRTVLEKMDSQFSLQVETSVPAIDYRETITKSAKGHHRHKKQSGGAGQFGEVYLEVEPLQRGQGFEFVDKVVGGAIPYQFIPAVEKGVKQVLQEGAISGFPMQDVKVTVYDGKYHAVDSKEIAFVAAGKKAFLDAISSARPIVLEPIVSISIIGPSEAMGDMTGDLSGHRGMINDTAALSRGRIQISAKLPLAEISDFLSRLNSITGGEGSFTLAFSHFDPVPDHVQKELASQYKVQEAD